MSASSLRGRRSGGAKRGRRLPPVTGARRPVHRAPRKAGSARLEALAAELREAARSAGIRVRKERLIREVGYHTQSGLCRVDGEEILLLDSDLPTDREIELLAVVLETRDLSAIELSDEATKLLAGAGVRQAS